MMDAQLQVAALIPVNDSSLALLTVAPFPVISGLAIAGK